MAAAILLAAQPIASWLGEQPGADAAISERKTDPVPVIRAADVRFDRARDLYKQGRLHDALRMLDGIDRGDPIRTDADALTAAIQSDLLATTVSTSQAEAAR